MDIVIVAQYIGNLDDLNKTNGRIVYLSGLLSDDNDVEIVTSTFIHGKKRQAECIPQEYQGCKITALYESGYPRNVCLKRFASHHQLAGNIKRYLMERKVPDAIYLTVPSLDVANIVARFCQKNSVRLIIDIIDLWPEAFQMVFHVPLISDIVYSPMRCIANKIYKQADEIVGVSQTYVDRALRVNKKCTQGYSVFLGTSLARFDQFIADEKLNENDGVIRLVYVGTLGHSYDLICVFDALNLIVLEGGYNFEFIIMGDGPLKEKFETYAHDLAIPVRFLGRLDYPEMVRCLTECDIAINPISKGASQSIINKHADYVAAGLPIISTQENKEFRNLIDKYKMGFNCNNADSKDVAKRLKQLIRDEELRIKMGEQARKCAEEHFDRDKTYQDLVQLVVKKQNV